MTAVTSRALAVLDLENLLYELWHAPDAALHLAFADLLSRCRQPDTPTQFVGCGDYRLTRRLAGAAHHHQVRLHPTRPGPDRADVHLLASLTDAAPTTLATIIIGSGDHIFAPAARRLRQAGKHLICVAATHRLSTELAHAVPTHQPYTPTPAATPPSLAAA
jgi:hypothetical protein